MQHINYLPYLHNMITIATIYIVAVISPGPDFAMILRNSLIYSKRSGLMAALGVSTGILMHATYTMLGLGVLIRNCETLFKIIQCAGAFYLIYMGVKSMRAKICAPEKTLSESPVCSDLSMFTAYKTGFLSNALNPMVIVFFISIFSSLNH